MNQKNNRAQRRHFLIGAGVGLVLPGLAIPDIALGQADNWPSKPLRLGVPSAPRVPGARQTLSAALLGATSKPRSNRLS